MSTDEKLDMVLAELKQLRETVEARPAATIAPAAPTDDTLLTTAAMALMGYSDRKRFMEAVRRQRMPYTRENSRRFTFSRAALLAWKASKTRNVFPT